ncbi:hypothetical protein WA577_002383 [Blastocystis sp. JDR]
MLKAIVEKRRTKQVIENEDTCETIFEEGMSEYEMAVAFVRSGKCRLSDAAKLALYGLYKQATVGDVNTACPSFDMVGAAKWKSWSSYKGLSKEEAQSKYVDYVTKLVPLWKKADEVQQMETTEGNVASTDSGFGLKVSTMKLGNEEDWKEGNDVFTYMGEKNEEKVLKFIESHPEDINKQDSNGRTLLHWACDRGSLPIVEKLLEHGCDVHIKDQDEMTALDNALVCEQYEIATLLLQKGARLSDCLPYSLDLAPKELLDSFASIDY